MCKVIEIGGQKFFLSKDYEEMAVVNFLYNPGKRNLLIKPIELLIPVGECTFSPYVSNADSYIVFMGVKFKCRSYDTLCPRTKMYTVEILGKLLNFHVDRVGSRFEKLMAVRS